MRVQNPAHVLRLETVLRELCLEHLILADPALHPEAVHDLRVGGARVDENRRVSAEDQVAEGRHPEANAHVLAEDEEARVELDVDQRQDLDLKTHGSSLLRSVWGDRATRIMAPFRARKESRPCPRGQCDSLCPESCKEAGS